MAQGNTGLWAKLQERLREPLEEGRKMAHAQAGQKKVSRKAAGKTASKKGIQKPGHEDIQKPGHRPTGRRAVPRRAAAGYRRALEERASEVRGNIDERLREATKLRKAIEAKIERGLKVRARKARR